MNATLKWMAALEESIRRDEAPDSPYRERSRLQGNYLAFVRHFWPSIPGVGKYVHNWHIELYCRELEGLALRVFRGQPRLHDLVVNVPFGTSKSIVHSVLLQPWVWTFFPEARFLYATHTDSLALDLAAKAKDVIESDEYRRLFPGVAIRRDRAAKDDYANTQGGERKSCTVGGKTPTGRHAHFIVVDDPIDPQGARSTAELDTAAKFMTEVLPSRMVDKKLTPTVLVQQRVEHRDPTAVVLRVAAQPGAVPVRQVCLPGELVEGAGTLCPPLEELRQTWPYAYADGLLDPYRLDRDVLGMYRSKLGSYAYSAQVLQNPKPRSGGLFKPQYFNRRARSAPREAVRVRFWDRAATEGGGCATAGVLIARTPDGTLYVEHCVHGRWEPNERNDRIVATAKADRLRYGPRYEPTVVIEAERGSTGLESFQRIAARLQGHRVKEDRPTGSKDVRAEPWADQLAAGNVVICDGGEGDGGGKACWDVQGYIDEHLLFMPDASTRRLGDDKDRVDASSGGSNWLAAHGQPTPEMRVVAFRSREKRKHPTLIVCPTRLLPALEAEQRAVLVTFADPGEEPATPEHHLTALLEHFCCPPFADLDPDDHHATWNAPVPPWGKPAAELVMTREHGKVLWRLLLKPRQPAPELWVFAGDDRRPDGVAKAVADVLGIPRQTLHYADPDNGEGQGQAPPANAHVYAAMKAARGMLM